MLLKGSWEESGAPPSPHLRSPSKTNSGAWLLGKPASSPIATGSDWTRVGGETISILTSHVHPLHANTVVHILQSQVTWSQKSSSMFFLNLPLMGPFIFDLALFRCMCLLYINIWLISTIALK